MNFLIPLHRQGELPCPECARLMTPYKCESAVVDMCHECKGIWFDRKEIGVFRNALARFNYSELDIDGPVEGLVRYEIYSCPRCREVLSEATYGYNSKVKVHACVSCKGMWVPLHEVIHLVEMAKTAQELAPDLRGALREIKAMDAENRRMIWLTDFATWIMTRGFWPWRRWWW